MGKGIVVDADSHILEPEEMWQEYIDPRFRGRAMRISVDQQGQEYLNIDGMMSSSYRGGLGTIGRGIGKDYEWRKQYATMPYTESLAFVLPAVDPHERIKHLAKEGVDKTFLFPTLGLGWEVEYEDPHLSEAYCQAYNRWLVDFCKPYPHQLYPVAHVSVRDVKEGVKELERAAKEGMKGAFLCPMPVNGIRYGHEYYDPFWAAAQDLEMPVTLHVINNPKYIGSHLFPDDTFAHSKLFIECLVFGDTFLSFTNMMTEGVFEKFPGLRLSMVEIGCTWIAHWLDFLDFKFDRFGFGTRLTMLPSEYFRRQCWISAEPIEKGLGAVAKIVGTDRFMWGSDWPHTEGHPDAVRKVKENIADLPEEDQRKILGENTLALYRINKPLKTAR